MKIIPLQGLNKQFEKVGGNEFKHDSNSRGQLSKDEPPLMLPNELVEPTKYA